MIKSLFYNLFTNSLVDFGMLYGVECNQHLLISVLSKHTSTMFYLYGRNETGDWSSIIFLSYFYMLSIQSPGWLRKCKAKFRVKLLTSCSTVQLKRSLCSFSRESYSSYSAEAKHNTRCMSQEDCSWSSMSKPSNRHLTTNIYTAALCDEEARDPLKVLPNSNKSWWMLHSHWRNLLHWIA